MGASPKNKRQQPERKFEGYVLTSATGPGLGLYPVNSQKMSLVESSGPSARRASEQGLASTDSVTGDGFLDLGFTFSIDNVDYKTACVSSTGFVVLLSPNVTTSSFSYDDIFDGLPGPINNKYILDVFVNNHLLLMPWSDKPRTVWRYLDGKNAVNETPFNTYLDVNDKPKYANGISTLPEIIDSSTGGVKYFRDTGALGRCLVVRWKNIPYWDTSSPNTVTYDLVIYENGSIEFRYAPRNNVIFDAVEGASAGIFFGGQRYRDLAPALGALPGTNPRGTYANGGAVYNGNYFDITGNKYTSSLKVYDNWPGRDLFGSVFSFLPPRNRRKQNRSIVNLRDSKPFINMNGNAYFDDRRTIPFVEQSVEYPSMIPPQFKTTSNSSDPSSVIELFQTGSIAINRVFSSGLYDSVLEDSMLEGEKKRGS